MNSLVNFFNFFLDILYRGVRVIGAVMLALLIGLTGTDVFMRYVFNDPVQGSVELTQFLLGPMIFAGFAMVTAHRSHIVVSIFEPFLLQYVPRLYRGLVTGFNLVGIIAITYIVFRYTNFEYLMQAETEILELKWGDLGVVFFALSVAAVFLGVKALWWPRRKGTYVAPKGVVIPQTEPCSIELEEGKKYAWCACGRSGKQPFCDGSHKGTDIKPVVFVAETGGLTRMCACKVSDNAPYCNGRHNDLKGSVDHFGVD